jgi:cysteine synthase
MAGKALMNTPDDANIIGCVGGTPLVELKRVVPTGHARVLVKIESQNPTGSMKDRMALSVIDGAEASRCLLPNGRVVEYTGGSTGTSLAFVCAARGFSITWDRDLVDDIQLVSTAEAKEMTRRLAREEALFAGTSSGANVVAALRVAERLGSGSTVVTLLCDSGLKYLSTDLYSEG